jgi:hypothetical protein
MPLKKIKEIMYRKRTDGLFFLERENMIRIKIRKRRVTGRPRKVDEKSMGAPTALPARCENENDIFFITCQKGGE